MENFTFFPATKYIFGRGVENQVARQLADFGMASSKVMIVYGRGSVVRSGLLDRVRGYLREASVEWVELGGVQPNPVDSKVYEGIDLARREGVGALLAVGGGSAIDTAKAIAAGVPYEGDFWDFYGGHKPIEKALPLGVILTIPAAGSEGSGNSVITKLDGLHKISIRTESLLRPRFALLDPTLTFTLPPYQTAAGIVDMMAHILERYFTPTTGVEITDRVAEGVLKAIITEAPKVIASPEDYDARANIMWSGTLAHNGICGTGRVEDWASHGLEHELSAVYGVTHGAGLAVIVPAWMSYMTGVRPGKIAQFARRVFDVNEVDNTRAARIGITLLRRFFHEIGMPVTLSELGIKNPDIDLLVAKVHENKGAS
ncbi:MAG: iron-containing alcohol dehydrogenase, partial [Paramuribaculum sp.]|nr:iron-containing alcohol dehydrogenase [Paramuribaculum sp.]